MVIDSSALVAIILEEPGFEDLAAKIDDAESLVIGAPTLFESAMVLRRKADSSVARMMAFLRTMDAEIVPFTEKHYTSAIDAFVRFGKGRHPARLNLGDCMSYAVAEVARLPLLFTGDDFAKTDIEAA